MLPPLRCMTLLGPPYLVYPCERREFSFELEFLGMANLCPVPLHYDVRELSFFSFGIYFRWLFVRSFDSTFVFLSFYFVMNFMFMFAIFLVGHNYK